MPDSGGSACLTYALETGRLSAVALALRSRARRSPLIPKYRPSGKENGIKNTPYHPPACAVPGGESVAPRYNTTKGSARKNTAQA